MKEYDIIIVGAGAAGVFMSYELTRRQNSARVLMIDKGAMIDERQCPISKGLTDHCIMCNPCHIMNGYGGAGTLSDGKYNITTAFGGDLHAYVGEEKAMELMEYVDEVLCGFDGHVAKLYSTENSDLKTLALRNNLNLLSAKVRHFGTDRNVEILKKIYEYVSGRVDMQFRTSVEVIDKTDDGFIVKTGKGDLYSCRQLVLATGRSGSKWISHMCRNLGITTRSNRVDIGLRVELPAEIFKHITDEVYESKLVYKTDKYNDLVRTFCMNPYGIVVNENTNGIVTVNGHSFEDPSQRTQNTNFALLVSKHFTEPFKDSNGYGEGIARLSNMLGGGVIVQRFGDLIRGRRSNHKRIEESFVRPTLQAEPGDLSLVLPKRILDGIIEMIYALDRIAPGTANDDTLLYGVEVKFYNMEVKVDNHLETKYKGLYMIGDGSGVTHSLSHASASGVFVARDILNRVS